MCSLVDHTLDRADADRVRLQAVADPHYDETNWWQGKEGTLDLFNAYIHLGYIWINGDGGQVQPALLPDDYEHAIVAP